MPWFYYWHTGWWIIVHKNAPSSGNKKKKESEKEEEKTHSLLYCSGEDCPRALHSDKYVDVLRGCTGRLDKLSQLQATAARRAPTWVLLDSGRFTEATVRSQPEDACRLLLESNKEGSPPRRSVPLTWMLSLVTKSYLQLCGWQRSKYPSVRTGHGGTCLWSQWFMRWRQGDQFFKPNDMSFLVT